MCITYEEDPFIMDVFQPYEYMSFRMSTFSNLHKHIQVKNIQAASHKRPWDIYGIK